MYPNVLTLPALSGGSYSPNAYYTKDAILRRRNEMVMVRQTWWDHWRDIAQQILPRHARFFYTDRYRAGTKKNDLIINNTPTRAVRVCAAGMMAGITSPVREWFRLSVNNPALMKIARVKSWLFEVEETMRVLLQRSNFYRAAAHAYLDLVTFGTHACYIEEDLDDIVRFYPTLIGSYQLASSTRGVVDMIGRDISMTVKQVVENFGLNNCSKAVQDFYKRGQLQTWVDIYHLVEPNRTRDLQRADFKGMKFISTWLEIVNINEGGMKKAEARDPHNQTFLRQQGYREFPAVCPRWFVSGEDMYGSCPGMEALGDCRALQLLERRAMQAFDKVVNPPMVAPSSLRNQRATLLPADVTYVDSLQGNTFKPAIEINPKAMEEARLKIKEHEDRIKETFYYTLWLTLIEDERTQPGTAREVEEKHEEKLLQLGPVLESISDEFLSPTIERVYAIAQRAKLFPPAPPEVEGKNIEIEYLNIASTAQKMQGTGAVERLAGFVGSVAPVYPQAIDVLDIDEVITTYADMLGTKPDLLHAPDEIQKLRAERAKQQQAQSEGAAMAQAAKGAKDIGTAGPAGQNALARVLSQAQPGTVATPEQPGPVVP